jgi:tungstate transport system ATP-binding protein
MNPALYDLDGIVHRYDSRTVLTLDHLKLHQGEIFGLVGPSGAGKSTLLRFLNFLETPTQGLICFEGRRMNHERPVPLPIKRKITTVFQRPALLDRSVIENVAYGLKLRGQDNWQERAREALAQVSLDHIAHARTRTLSGGETQRVALARALVLEPEVLLLDEPTANLDPYNVALIEDIVTKSHTSKSITVVMVTHNIFQAQRVAQRVGFLLEGELIEVSDRDAFFNKPADPRTEAFIRGEMVY